MSSQQSAAKSIPTFLVGAAEQKELLDQFQKRCLHFTEAYQRNKPLCFNARAYQRPHFLKEQSGSADADATLTSPMLLGICDGVSQVEDLGLDAAELPKELLRSCESIATAQLVQESSSYAGPISLLKEAYAETESLGSTSVLLAVMDNSTQIHGKLHPMIGVVTLGDCELVLIRRSQTGLQVVLHTDKQRIGGNNQTPLQLARMTDALDDETDALDAIERGSGLHCLSTYEGDVIIMGSDGVFDNLFLSEVVAICEDRLPKLKGMDNFQQAPVEVLDAIAQCIVQKAHAKSDVTFGKPLQTTPVGAGGKADDTSVVVAEVVEWSSARHEAWKRKQSRNRWSFGFCGGSECAADQEAIDSEEEEANCWPS